MSDKEIHAILTVMNLAAPEGSEWCAWSPEPGYLDKERGIVDHWRFYLVNESSPLHDDTSGNILWGT